MYDVDSMRFSLSLEQYNHFLKTLEMELPFDHTRQRYGATSNDDDIFLRQSNLVQRRMVPRNGAEFAHLGQVDFDAVTLNDLIAAQYSGEDIIGDDSNNQLTPGAVIGIKTNQGNYAKLRIDGYVPLTRGNRKRGNRRTEYKKYNFRVTLGLYSEVYQNREFF